MPSPKELTRAEIIHTAGSFNWTRKMPKWRVVVNSRELPARPLVLEAAGVAPNDPTNSHQAVAILERLGFETRYVRETSTTVHRYEVEKAENTESIADVFSKITHGINETEWAKIPTDFSKNVDHYLYGSKKVGK